MSNPVTISGLATAMPAMIQAATIRISNFKKGERSFI
jgi:hypothetical protein